MTADSIPALADAIDPRLPRPQLIPLGEPHMAIPYSDLIAASDALRANATALSTALEIGRAMGVEQAAKYHDAAAQDIRAAVDAPNFDGNERLYLNSIADHEMYAGDLRALPSLLNTDELVEKVAEHVHVAYLETARRLEWRIDPECDRPYADLPDDAKELDRATARAVLASIGVKL